MLLMELQLDLEILARLKFLRSRSHVRIVLGRPKARLANEIPKNLSDLVDSAPGHQESQ